jgi:hypothetical protein
MRNGKMAKNIINKDEFDKWTKENFIEYASETINNKRLRFLINLEGKVKVSHENNVLYEGYDFQDASNIYKNVW